MANTEALRNAEALTLSGRSVRRILHQHLFPHRTEVESTIFCEANAFAGGIILQIFEEDPKNVVVFSNEVFLPK